VSSAFAEALSLGAAQLDVGSDVLTPEQIAAGQGHLLWAVQNVKSDYVINWHHEQLAEALQKVQSGEITRLMVFMPPRHGKALEDSTPIPTPDGWKAMGDLRVGDMVFSDSGKQVAVQAVHHWRDRELYRVTTDDGHSVLADSEHLWTVRLCRKRPTWKDHRTAYLANRPSPRRPMIPTHGAIECDEADLPLKPYTLGVWLGDGNRRHAFVTSNEHDIDFTREQIELDGFETRLHTAKGNFGILGLLTKLRAMNLLDNKHIPDEYFRASKAQRLALLQGLIDTDGYIAPCGQIEFCSTTRALADGALELVHSLGVKASLLEGRATLDGVDYGPKYRVMFYMGNASRLPRRKKFARDAIKVNRYLSFEKAGMGDTTCISVGGNGRFLCGKGMFVTHNSELVSRHFPAWCLGKEPSEKIIACSYSATLAGKMGRDVQNIMSTSEYQAMFSTRLKSGVEARKGSAKKRETNLEFDIVNGSGGYVGAGVGGPIGGFGFSLGIIDDYFKNREEAESANRRDILGDWYTSTFYTRREGRMSWCGADRIVVTTTLWHEDGLAGRILADAKKAGEVWHIIRFPAIADHEDAGIYEANMGNDPRSEGEALWPWKLDEDDLKTNRRMSSRDWMSLYQCRPSAQKGNIFERNHWQEYDELPKGHLTYTFSLDCAFKDGDKASFVVLQLWANKGPNHYLVEQWRGQRDYRATKALCRAKFRDYPQAMTKIIEEKANGAAIINELGEEFSGLVAVNPKGSKAARAMAVQGLVEGGNVHLPRHADWREEFLNETASFPWAKNDDQVDAMTQYLERANTGGSSFLTNLLENFH
jgi:predicted phage terminase large subunit-like protein